jgi:hypothetical protein
LVERQNAETQSSEEEKTMRLHFLAFSPFATRRLGVHQKMSVCNRRSIQIYDQGTNDSTFKT